MLHHMLRAAAARAFSVLDPYFQYVTMLLHGDGTNGAQNNTFLDSSTNNFTITRNGNTTQGTFTPYGSNWSNYMTSGYLTTASNADFALSADFTVECWVFSGDSSLDGSTRRRIFHTGGGDVAASLQLLLGTSAGNSAVISVLNNGFLIDGTISVVTSSWNHVAVTRSGTSLKLFVNGVQSGSTATTSQNFNSGTSNTVYIGANSSGGGIWQGYISNLSVVNGTALYTSAFTPPTAPLSTGTTNQKLLVCQVNRFIDSNTATTAKTITVNSTPSVQRFSPFAPLTVYNPTTYGGSGYFDGDGDGLTSASSSAFAFGTGDFTYEGFYYSLESGSSQRGMFDTRLTSNSTAGVLLLEESTNGFKVYINNTTLFTTTGRVANTWQHIALVRQSGTVRLYINGVQANSAASSTNMTDNNCRISGFVDTQASPYGYFGYISNARVLKGTCLYPSGTTFTPPTAPLTAITNTSLLLNLTNAGILDNAMMNNLETVGNAQISTSVKKYGTGSMYFDGTGDWLMTPNRTNLNVGSGDFTVEAWVYTGSTLQQVIIGANRNSDGVGAFMLNLNYTGKVRFFCSYSGGTFLDYNVGSGTISDSAWHHIAATRSGSSLRIFIDGTQTGTTNTTLGTASIDNAIADYRVGSTTDGALNFNGYIDDLRITKYARYTTTFTPSTTAFPNN